MLAEVIGVFTRGGELCLVTYDEHGHTVRTAPGQEVPNPLKKGSPMDVAPINLRLKTLPLKFAIRLSSQSIPNSSLAPVRPALYPSAFCGNAGKKAVVGD